MVQDEGDEWVQRIVAIETTEGSQPRSIGRAIRGDALRCCECSRGRKNHFTAEVLSATAGAYSTRTVLYWTFQYLPSKSERATVAHRIQQLTRSGRANATPVATEGHAIVARMPKVFGPPPREWGDQRRLGERRWRHVAKGIDPFRMRQSTG